MHTRSAHCCLCPLVPLSQRSNTCRPCTQRRHVFIQVEIPHKPTRTLKIPREPTKPHDHGCYKLLFLECVSTCLLQRGLGLRTVLLPPCMTRPKPTQVPNTILFQMRHVTDYHFQHASKPHCVICLFIMRSGRLDLLGVHAIPWEAGIPMDIKHVFMWCVSQEPATCPHLMQGSLQKYYPKFE